MSVLIEKICSISSSGSNFGFPGAEVKITDTWPMDGSIKMKWEDIEAKLQIGRILY